MNEEKTIKTVNWLLLLASAFLFYGVTYTIAEQLDKPERRGHPQKVEIPREEPKTKEESPNFYPLSITARADFEKVIIPGTVIETEFLGYYFITAYCPEECGGSWSTSSGATCHYSEDWLEPTTCAIDRNVHGYNELLLVGEPDDPERKIYITEDTGPGVRGNWVDCFVESMDEARAWPTGWRPVYSVSIERQNIIKTKGQFFYESFRNYLFVRSGCGWLDPRDDRRVDD